MKELEEYCSHVVDAVDELWLKDPQRNPEEFIRATYPDMAEDALTTISQFKKRFSTLQLQEKINQFAEKLPLPFTEKIEKHLAWMIEFKSTIIYELEIYVDARKRIQEKVKKSDHDPIDEQYLKMHIEHGYVKFSELYHAEESLKKWQLVYDSISGEVGALAKSFGLEEYVGIELLNYKLDGFFSRVHESHWNQFIDGISAEEKKLLKQYYKFSSKNSFYQLNSDLGYYSLLSEEQLVGTKSEQLGLSYLNNNVKRVINWKMKPFFVIDVQKEVQQFFRFVCKEALKDGILTQQEIQQMLDISEALQLERNEACRIMNEVAIGVQQDLIYTTLKMMFEMANAAEGIQREEQAHILELKSRYHERMVKDIGEQFLSNPNSNLELCVTEEGIFEELLRLAFKGNDFGKEELEILKNYAKSMQWPEEKVKLLIEKVAKQNK